MIASTYSPETWPGDTRPLYVRALERRNEINRAEAKRRGRRQWTPEEARRIGAEARQTGKGARRRWHEPSPVIRAKRIARGCCGDCGRPRGFSGTTKRCGSCATKARAA